MVYEKFKPCGDSVGKAFQMDDYGNFRIVVHGFPGKWVSYEGMASLTIYDEQYIGVSAFYEGILPHECVLKVVKIDIVDSEEHSST